MAALPLKKLAFILLVSFEKQATDKKKFWGQIPSSAPF